MGAEWQDKYRYAKAFEQASAEIINFLIGLKNQNLALLEKEKEDEPDFDNA